jgi:hypothetical protein
VASFCECSDESLGPIKKAGYFWIGSFSNNILHHEVSK